MQEKLHEDVLFVLRASDSNLLTQKSYILSVLSECLELFSKTISYQKKKKLQCQYHVGKAPVETERKSASAENEDFTSLFPIAQNILDLNSQLLLKGRRKVHYLLAFANENPIKITPQ